LFQSQLAEVQQQVEELEVQLTSLKSQLEDRNATLALYEHQRIQLEKEQAAARESIILRLDESVAQKGVLADEIDKLRQQVQVSEEAGARWKRQCEDLESRLGLAVSQRDGLTIELEQSEARLQQSLQAAGDNSSVVEMLQAHVRQLEADKDSSRTELDSLAQQLIAAAAQINGAKEQAQLFCSQVQQLQNENGSLQSDVERLTEKVIELQTAAADSSKSQHLQVDAENQALNRRLHTRLLALSTQLGECTREFRANPGNENGKEQVSRDSTALLSESDVERIFSACSSQVAEIQSTWRALLDQNHQREQQWLALTQEFNSNEVTLRKGIEEAERRLIEKVSRSAWSGHVKIILLCFC
jgi:chromosome segregation ATPase